MPYFLNLFTKKFVLTLFIEISIFASVLAFLHLTGVQAQTGDITAPTTAYVLTPSSPDGNNDWYVTPVNIQLNATDLETGVKNIKYRIDGGSWQTVDFSNTQNLAPNASFETSASNSTGASSWAATVSDPEGTYTRDTTNAAPGFGSASMKIVATGGTWHGVNHSGYFAATLPYDNMTASAVLKTDSVTGTAFFKVYAVSPDGSGGYIYQEIAQSNTITGTLDWTQVLSNFTVNVSDAVGVYVDIGIVGPGTVWIDAVNLTTAYNQTSTSFIVATDAEDHTVEFYSEDFSSNVESHSCTSPKQNCIEFKLDQTPPGNWSNSGAIRQIGGGPSASHMLWVFTDVEDATSGLSTNTNKYQYHTETAPGFGYYSNLLACNSTWNEDGWESLEDAVTTSGTNVATVKTQKTNFCNSNWKICKTVRFYAEDEAGNIKTKDLCLNGPWVKIRGEGFIRSNAYIDMVAEANEDNTDSLIEVNGLSIDFFTSSTGWTVRSSPNPTNLSYDDLYEDVKGSKTVISNGNLVSSSGVYEVNGNLSLGNSDVPNNYDTNTFDQVVFVDGDLTIDANIVIDDASTALFIVNGDVLIDEGTRDLQIAIFAQGDIQTAYNLSEGQSTQTLDLKGIYIADEIKLQRTLQGTNNNDTPSESFIYEPKYIIQLKQFFEFSNVQWLKNT